jgi:hypothetical protein
MAADQYQLVGAIPAFRQTSPTGVPSSACFKIKAICASENFVIFIACSCFRPPIINWNFLTQNGPKSGKQVRCVLRLHSSCVKSLCSVRVSIGEFVFRSARKPGVHSSSRSSAGAASRRRRFICATSSSAPSVRTAPVAWRDFL